MAALHALTQAEMKADASDNLTSRRSVDSATVESRNLDIHEFSTGPEKSPPVEGDEREREALAGYGTAMPQGLHVDLAHGHGSPETSDIGPRAPGALFAICMPETQAGR